MRYLLGAVFLASCTALTPSSTDNASVEAPPPVVTTPATESEQEVRKPKPKTAPPPVTEVSSCANLKMADLKETIRAKLDCISENAK